MERINCPSIPGGTSEDEIIMDWVTSEQWALSADSWMDFSNRSSNFFQADSQVLKPAASFQLELPRFLDDLLPNQNGGDAHRWTVRGQIKIEPLFHASKSCLNGFQSLVGQLASLRRRDGGLRKDWSHGPSTVLHSKWPSITSFDSEWIADRFREWMITSSDHHSAKTHALEVVYSDPVGPNSGLFRILWAQFASLVSRFKWTLFLFFYAALLCLGPWSFRRMSKSPFYSSHTLLIDGKQAMCMATQPTQRILRSLVLQRYLYLW